MMDDRVAALIDELGKSSNIDPLAARIRIVALFDQVCEEDDRVRLLMALQAVIGLAIRSQEAQGVDSQPLRNAFLADKRTLALKEAMGPNELAEPTELFRILKREVDAGRMERDEFYELAAAGAQVLGSPARPQAKTRFLKRLFG